MILAVTMRHRAWGGAPSTMGTIEREDHDKYIANLSPTPNDRLRPTTPSLCSSFACVGTVHDAFSPLSTALGGDRLDYARCHQAASSRWPPQRSSNLLHRPLCAAGCGNASPHYLRQRCMIPWHDLGSSPRHAACPSGLLPPLDGRRPCR